jgi:hypothetical protein
MDKEKLSKEFIDKVEELCRKLEPKNKENNHYGNFINEVCKEDKLLYPTKRGDQKD